MKRSTLLHFSGAIALLLHACTAKPASQQNESSIINGAVPDAKWFHHTINVSGCTGILVGEFIALTAAHCIAVDMKTGGPVTDRTVWRAPKSLNITAQYLDDGGMVQTESIPVEKVYYHRILDDQLKPYKGSLHDLYNDEQHASIFDTKHFLQAREKWGSQGALYAPLDLVVLKLKQRPKTDRRVRIYSPSAATKIMMVGYGLNKDTDGVLGKNYSGETRLPIFAPSLSDVGTFRVRTSFNKPSIASGDSGGPALGEEVVDGMTNGVVYGIAHAKVFWVEKQVGIWTIFGVFKPVIAQAAAAGRGVIRESIYVNLGSDLSKNLVSDATQDGNEILTSLPIAPAVACSNTPSDGGSSDVDSNTPLATLDAGIPNRVAAILSETPPPSPTLNPCASAQLLSPTPDPGASDAGSGEEDDESGGTGDWEENFEGDDVDDSDPMQPMTPPGP